MQFDQPVLVGSNGVASNIEVDVLDQSGNIVAQGNTNTVAQGLPLQFTQAIAPGIYNVAIKVDAGPDPGHVVFYNFGGDMTVDHKFGTGGGTFYPGTSGHNSSADAISVGAVPWWTSTAFLPSNTNVVNEPFSSFGPRLMAFNPDGSSMTPTLLAKPDVSGADGGNTSFFGQAVDTSQPFFTPNPPYPGNTPTTTTPATTPTNLSQNLPSFFGTSAAVENVAAVAVLAKQLTPGITKTAILNALTSSATPLNGQAKGTYNSQAGFGFVNAPAALAAASVLRVVSITPGAGQTISVAPTSILVTFNKPVNLASYVPGGFFVIGANGATVTRRPAGRGRRSAQPDPGPVPDRDPPRTRHDRQRDLRDRLPRRDDHLEQRPAPPGEPGRRLQPGRGRRALGSSTRPSTTGSSRSPSTSRSTPPRSTAGPSSSSGPIAPTPTGPTSPITS